MTTERPWLKAYGDLWEKIKEASPDYDQMAAKNARTLGAQLMFGAYHHDAQKIAQFLQDYRNQIVRDPKCYTKEYYTKITAMVADAVGVESRAIIQNNLSEYNPQEVSLAVSPAEEPVAVAVVAGASAGGSSSYDYDEDSSSDDEDTEGGVALRPDTRKWTFRW